MKLVVRRFSSVPNSLEKSSKLKDLTSLFDVRNFLVTFPYSDLKLSASGELNPTPTMDGKDIRTGRNIRRIRGSSAGEFIDPIMNALKINKEPGPKDMVNMHRFLVRGQSRLERMKGQISPMHKEWDSMLHTRGDIRAISTSFLTFVARYYAGMNLLKAVATMNFSVPEIVVFDSSLLNNKFESVILQSNDAWEGETAVFTPVPLTAMLGWRPVVGPFSIGPFVYNELYIDINLAPAKFLTKHEEFHQQFEALMKECYKADLEGVLLTEVKLNQVIEIYVEIFKRYKESLSPERFEKIGVNLHRIFQTDKVAKNVRESYSKVVESQTPASLTV